jgi:hypothetical protein
MMETQCEVAGRIVYNGDMGGGSRTDDLMILMTGYRGRCIRHGVFGSLYIYIYVVNAVPPCYCLCTTNACP